MVIHVVNMVKSSVHYSAAFRRFWRKLTELTSNSGMKKVLVKCIKNKKLYIVKLK